MDDDGARQCRDCGQLEGSSAQNGDSGRGRLGCTAQIGAFLRSLGSPRPAIDAPLWEPILQSSCRLGSPTQRQLLQRLSPAATTVREPVPMPIQLRTARTGGIARNRQWHSRPISQWTPSIQRAAIPEPAAAGLGRTGIAKAELLPRRHGATRQRLWISASQRAALSTAVPVGVAIPVLAAMPTAIGVRARTPATAKP